MYSENRKFRRFYWVGDLKEDYYIAFQLVNIQRDDAGDYGVKLRVDNYSGRPMTLQCWFTLKVKVRKVSSLPFKTITKTLSCLQTSPSWTIIEVSLHFFSWAPPGPGFSNFSSGQWWSVAMVARYGVISSRWSSHFWVKMHVFLTSSNNKSCG